MGRPTTTWRDQLRTYIADIREACVEGKKKTKAFHKKTTQVEKMVNYN
jgi:hypothetical protein